MLRRVSCSGTQNVSLMVDAIGPTLSPLIPNAALDTVPRFQPLVLATVVDPGGLPTRTGHPVGRWRPASSSARDGLIVSSTDSLTLRSETPANVARHPQGAVNGQRRGLATSPEGLSPRLEDGKEPVRVSSVVVAVTLGTALSRLGEAVRVYGVLHMLWRRSVTYMTV